MRPALGLLLLVACADPTARTDARASGRVSVRAPEETMDAGPDDASDPADPDAPVELPSVAILTPDDGATFARGALSHGYWVAPIDVTVEARGVATLALFVAGAELARAPATTDAFEVEADEDGAIEIAIVGYDTAGLERARDAITVTVTPPADTGCHAMLDALGLDWEPLGAIQGIADPVRVQPVIGGVRYRYVSNAEPSAMTMDCELAPRLARLSELVTPYGIDEVVHIGIYNYRCIGGGDPDTDGCTPSMHAQARAIDLAGFGFADSDVWYSVNDDWIITDETCPGSPSGDADRVLHELACAMWSDRIFEIVLTPNYNADHRNHFHVDMTPGSMFIGYSISGIDPDVPGLGHRDVDGHPGDFGDDGY